MAKSIIQKDRTKCYLCGKNGSCDRLEEHHIFFAFNRKKSEKYGLTVYLCGNECHRLGKNSVHTNAKICGLLQAKAQRIAMKHYDWTLDDWMHIFGRNYI